MASAVVKTKSGLSLLLSCAGRFDELVIDERRQGIVQLLQFAASVPELLHSEALAIFFQVVERVYCMQHNSVS